MPRLSRKSALLIVVGAALLPILVVPLLLGSGRIAVYGQIEFVTIQLYLLVAIGALIITRTSRRERVMVYAVMTLWLLSAAFAGYSFVTTGEAGGTIRHRIDGLILSEFWFPLQWPPQWTRGWAWWSVIDSMLFWTVASAVLVAWPAAAAWARRSSRQGSKTRLGQQQ